MVYCAVVVIVVFVSSFVECSSIITKNMIRMPDFTRITTPGSQLPKPEMLVAKPLNDDVKPESTPNSEDKRSRVVDSRVFDEESSLDKPIGGDFAKVDSSKPTPNISSTMNDLNNAESRYISVSEDVVDKKVLDNLKSTISPKELSSKYWLQYKNFSNEFFGNLKFPDTPKTESEIEKRNQEYGVLDVMQKVLRCIWMSELSSCVLNGFGGASTEELSFLHLMTPRLLSLQIGDSENGFTERNDDFHYTTEEDDEGRKRLSKRLSQLIPFLVMLKMTMLPALAVMALVSGKAFLMSLLSLGAALVATFSAARTLPADKRQELFLHHQSFPNPQPSDKLPDKYYYVM